MSETRNQARIRELERIQEHYDTGCQKCSLERIGSLERQADKLGWEVRRLENKLSCQAINAEEAIAEKNALLKQRECFIVYLEKSLNEFATDGMALQAKLQKLRAFRDTVSELIGLTD